MAAKVELRLEWTSEPDAAAKEAVPADIMSITGSSALISCPRLQYLRSHSRSCNWGGFMNDKTSLSYTLEIDLDFFPFFSDPLETVTKFMLEEVRPRGVKEPTVERKLEVEEPKRSKRLSENIPS